MNLRHILLIALLPAITGCTPVRTAGNVAIGAGQVVLAGADLVI